jgi:hypothetical protein
MKKNIVLVAIFASLLWGFDFSHIFKKPNSKITVICDRDGEKIYLDDKFKTECKEGDTISLSLYEGKHKLVVKTEPSKDYKYYYFETKFNIGDGVEKTIKVKSKVYYTKQFFIQNAKKLIAFKYIYLQKYPNDEFSDKIRKELKGTWQKLYNKKIIPLKIIAVNDGYVMLGNSFGSSKRYMVISKIDKLGNLLWSKNFGADNDIYSKGFYLTADHGFLIIGEIKDSNGNSKIYILKIDQNGNMVWDKKIKTNFKDKKYSSFIYAMPTKNKNIILIYYNKCCSYFIDKINPKTGKFVWTYKTNNLLYSNIQDMKEIKEKDYLIVTNYKIFELNLNKSVNKKSHNKTHTNYIVWKKYLPKNSKYFMISKDEFIGIDKGNSEVAKITKVDANSKIIWKKTINIPKSMIISLFDKLELTSYAKAKDGILFSSNIMPFLSFNNYEPYIFKINNDGKIKWANMLSLEGKITTISPIKDGVIIGGIINGKLWIMKVNKKLLDKYVEY